MIVSNFPGSRTLAFGSTLSGFGSDTSDMDLCVFFADYIDEYRDPERTAKKSQKAISEQSKKQLYKVRKILK